MNCPHCDVHVDEHEATRCLDAWIAKRIFKFEIFDDIHPVGVKSCGITAARFYYRSEFRHPQDGWPPVPEYSTDISAAWEVVEKFGACRVEGRDWGDVYWLQLYVTEGENKWVEGKCAETFPHAVCRAAIKAVHNAR